MPSSAFTPPPHTSLFPYTTLFRSSIFQRSDQYPFALHDIPAVWWFTGFHPDYHQPSDTVEKINFEKMEKIVRLAYLSGRALADAARDRKSTRLNSSHTVTSYAVFSVHPPPPHLPLSLHDALPI